MKTERDDTKKIHAEDVKWLHTEDVICCKRCDMLQKNVYFFGKIKIFKCECIVCT